LQYAYQINNELSTTRRTADQNKVPQIEGAALPLRGEGRRAIVMSKLGSASKCADCLVSTSKIHEYYMVTDEIWSLAWSGWQRPRPPGVGINCMLCVGCLERRIGRTLTRADFPDCPVNDLDDPEWRPRSARLKGRLTRKADGEP
jgi:hypothetical protein